MLTEERLCSENKEDISSKEEETKVHHEDKGQ
jgi:hypothetical protein